MQYVIDSSVLVAAFRDEEPYSREAFHILERLERGTLSALIPVTITLEVMAAIQRRTRNKKLAQEIGERLLDFPALSLIDITAFRMLRWFDLAASSGLRGMDVIIVGIATEFKLPLVTLDKEMIKIAKKFIDVIQVDQI